MKLHEAITPAQIARGLALRDRYQNQRLHTVAECDEFRAWLKAAYLDNPAVTAEQYEIARLLYVGTGMARLDLEKRHGHRP